MTQPFTGQIQPFAFGFAPRNWALCNGQIIPISQNTALFSLLGTLYGGNGTSNFALPNLQSRVPMHQGQGPDGNTYTPGEEAGAETVTIDYTTMPMHVHTLMGSADLGNAAQCDPGDAVANIGAGQQNPGDPFYETDTTPVPLNPLAVGSVGGNQAHTNIQPYLAINWCICLKGIFPTRN